MRRSIARVGMVAALLVSTSVAAQESSPPADIQLAPGDALRIEIKDEPALSGQFAVGVGGEVLLPLLGLRRATGRPFRDLEDELRTAYDKELVNAVVRITPIVRVAVLGEVRLPGLYPVDPTVKVLEVLATAGGFAPQANRRAISVVRNGQVVQVSLTPGSSGLDMTMRSGDQVIVGRRSWISENTPFLLGALGSVTAAAIASLIVR